jgi:ribulose-5-phosphate 4-epimerase/fuculose-1-phosphate aldolase
MNSEESELLDMAYVLSKYCIGKEGNVSGKINNNEFYIKASGARMSRMYMSDLVKFDLEENQLSNTEKRGSIELGFHTTLLKYDNVNYVAHTHPINTLKILCSQEAEEFATKRMFPEQVIFNGAESCLVPYTAPGDFLAIFVNIQVKSFIEAKGYFPKLILLENHGIITCGKTIDECIIATEICEKSAEIFLGSLNLGRVYLRPEEIDELLKDEKQKYRIEQP